MKIDRARRRALTTSLPEATRVLLACVLVAGLPSRSLRAALLHTPMCVPQTRACTAARVMIRRAKTNAPNKQPPKAPYPERTRAQCMSSASSRLEVARWMRRRFILHRPAPTTHTRVCLPRPTRGARAPPFLASPRRTTTCRSIHHRRHPSCLRRTPRKQLRPWVCPR